MECSARYLLFSAGDIRAFISCRDKDKKFVGNARHDKGHHLLHKVQEVIQALTTDCSIIQVIADGDGKDEACS